MNTQKTPRARLLAISGAALALVIAGGAVASAHPGGRDDQRGFGRDRGGPSFRQGGGHMGEGLLGPRAALRGGLRQDVGSVVRHETILQTEDGVVTMRVDHGTATSATDTALEYTLATGETVEVSIDDETQVIAFSEQTIERGLRSRSHMVPAEVAITEVAAGSDIGVWSESQADGTFLAQRIVVRPVAATDSDAAADTEDADAAVDPEAAAPAVDASAVPIAEA